MRCDCASASSATLTMAMRCVSTWSQACATSWGCWRGNPCSPDPNVASHPPSWMIHPPGPVSPPSVVTASRRQPQWRWTAGRKRTGRPAQCGHESCWIKCRLAAWGGEERGRTARALSRIWAQLCREGDGGDGPGRCSPPTHRLLTSKSNWVVGAGPTRAQTLKRAGETAGHARDPPVSSRHALELLATPAAQPTETDHCTFSQPKRTCNAKTRLCRCCAFSACCKLSPPSKVHLSRSRVLRSIDSILTCNQAVGHVPRSNHTKH